MAPADAVATVVSDDEAVRVLLQKNRPALQEQLAQVAGKVEMGLRVLWDVPNLFEYFVNHRPELLKARDAIGDIRQARHAEALVAHERAVALAPADADLLEGGRLYTNVHTAANAGGAGPQELPLDLIDEDPHQPRTADNPGFSPESIAEIGETIKARGVKSPISVRENPDAPGRYLINHGARRYRGSKWAHKTTIPAFIDNDYNEADQVIENLQRNELTAREIADFIGRDAELAQKLAQFRQAQTEKVLAMKLPEV